MKSLDLKGKSFGYLTVLEKDSITPAGHVTWICKCKCGKIVSRTGTSITRSKYSSCGCWSRYGKDNPLWEGVGEISKNWFHNVIVRAASGRKSRSGLTKKIDIDIEYIWDLFLKQNRKCIYSGLDLTFPLKNTNLEFKKATASLDRIDPTKGYVKGNVQWVHKHINIMKNIYSHDYFIELCKKVTNNCEIA
jgi:hypothetical protein